MEGFKSEKEEFELTSEFNFEQVLLQQDGDEVIEGRSSGGR